MPKNDNISKDLVESLINIKPNTKNESVDNNKAVEEISNKLENINSNLESQNTTFISMSDTINKSLKTLEKSIQLSKRSKNNVIDSKSLEKNNNKSATYLNKPDYYTTSIEKKFNSYMKSIENFGKKISSVITAPLRMYDTLKDTLANTKDMITHPMDSLMGKFGKKNKDEENIQIGVGTKSLSFNTIKSRSAVGVAIYWLAQQMGLLGGLKNKVMNGSGGDTLMDNITEGLTEAGAEKFGGKLFSKLFGKAGGKATASVAASAATSAATSASASGSTALASGGIAKATLSLLTSPVFIAGIGAVVGGVMMYKDFKNKKSAESITGKKKEDITGIDRFISGSAQTLYGNTGDGSVKERANNASKQTLKYGGLGATIGTFIMPGIGTAIGASVGSAFGGITGYIGGDNIAKALINMKDALFGVNTTEKKLQQTNKDIAKDKIESENKNNKNIIKNYNNMKTGTEDVTGKFTDLNEKMENNMGIWDQMKSWFKDKVKDVNTSLGGKNGPSNRQTNTESMASDAAYNGLGSIVNKYEGSTGTVSTGKGDKGGVSYGKMQLSSESGMAGFLKYAEKHAPEVYKKLNPLAGSMKDQKGAFAEQWKSMAKNGELTDIENQYQVQKYYKDPLSRIKNNSVKTLIEGNKGLQEAFLSTSQQHGSGSIFSKVYKEGMSAEELAKAVYAERGRKDAKGNMVYLSSSSKEVQNGVANRYGKELSEILSLAKSSTGGYGINEMYGKSKYTGGGVANGINGYDNSKANLPPDLFKYVKGVGNISKDKDAIMKMNPEILMRLYNAGKQMGKAVEVTSGWRSSDKQASLRNSQNNASKGISRHQLGNAVDLNYRNLSKEQIAILEANGLTQNLTKKGMRAEEQHFELNKNAKYASNKTNENTPDLTKRDKEVQQHNAKVAEQKEKQKKEERIVERRKEEERKASSEAKLRANNTSSPTSNMNTTQMAQTPTNIMKYLFGINVGGTNKNVLG